MFFWVTRDVSNLFVIRATAFHKGHDNAFELVKLMYNAFRQKVFVVISTLKRC
jgi:hypothetical protein